MAGRRTSSDSAPHPDSQGAGLPRSAASPCIGVCRLDPATGLCIGCRRSIEEIASWPDLESAERAAILARLAQRQD